MPTSSVLLSRFNRGELSRLIYGRTDIEWYFHGCRMLRNFLPLLQGPTRRRSGLGFVHSVYDHEKKSRLVRFEFSTTQAYILEFADQKIRFYMDGGIIESGGAPYEVNTTYTEDELFDLKFAQSADTLYIVHPNHAQAKLTRTGHTAWTLTDITFTAPPAAWTTGNYPRCVAFFEERLWFAGTPDEPQTIWGSRSGDYEDFTSGSDDDDSVEYTASADSVNAILWMVAGRDGMVVGTVGGEWRMYGNGDPLTPDNCDLKRETTYGSTNIQGLKVGASTLFVQRQGKDLREFRYEWESDSWNSWSMKHFSEHIVKPGVVDMAWAQAPQPYLFLVLADGTMAGLAYERPENVMGWALLETDGEIESVAVIPGDGHDEVWVVVKRSVKYVGWDIAIVDANGDGKADGKAGDTFVIPDGVTWESGCVVTGEDPGGTAKVFKYTGAVSLTASGASKAVTFSASPSGDQVEQIYNGSDVLDGSNWTALTSTDVDRRYVERLAPEFDGTDLVDAFFVDSGLSYSGSPISTVSGLDHLAGMEVNILADGAVLPPLVVPSTGVLTLPNSASNIHIGLGYTSILQTMALDVGGADGTGLGKIKRIHEVKFHFFETLGVQGLTFGLDEDHQDPLDFRSWADHLGDVPELFSGIYAAGKPPAGFDRWGSIMLRQTDPLPCTVIAVMLHLATEKK